MQFSLITGSLLQALGAEDSGRDSKKRDRQDWAEEACLEICDQHLSCQVMAMCRERADLALLGGPGP